MSATDAASGMLVMNSVGGHFQRFFPGRPTFQYLTIFSTGCTSYPPKKLKLHFGEPHRSIATLGFFQTQKSLKADTGSLRASPRIHILVNDRNYRIQIRQAPMVAYLKSGSFHARFSPLRYGVPGTLRPIWSLNNLG